MAGQGVKFVNKQFNSPINLYSPQAIQESLEKQTQVLSNGAIGIDFNQLAKPTNLQNSAVLRMLEEEEARKKSGQSNLKRVAWPPPPEDQEYDFIEQSPVQAKTRGVGEYATYQSSPSIPQPSVATKPNPPTVQLNNSGKGSVSPSPSSPLPQSPISPITVSPSGTLPRQPLQYQQQNSALKGWAPVTPPALLSSSVQPPLPKQPSVEQPKQVSFAQQQVPVTAPALLLSSSVQLPLPKQPSVEQPKQVSFAQQQQDRIPNSQSSQPPFEPPPTIITLRPEAPITQLPAEVYQAQPAATKAPIEGNMRGDLKWPPAPIKEQTEAENQARLELAKGPAVRPRRVHKDYTGFFSQHQLPNTYPGYRAPPGTQYFTPAYQQN